MLLLNISKFLTLSIVIPTYNREKDLIKCIESIVAQTKLPTEVIVIDDGNISDSTKNLLHFLLEKSHKIIFKYFKKDKPGLAESKNLGAKASKGDIVLFLDDDVILERNYLENLITIWAENQKDKKLAGISGFAKNLKGKSLLEKMFDRVFCLYSSAPWAILPWGFQTWSYDLKEEKKTDWIPGYNSSFKKEIFNEYQFKSLQSGRTALEDIEFCWKLKKEGYYFIVTPSLKLIHNESLAGREKAFATGYKEGFNRCLIFKIHAKKNLKNYICFLIASIGWILRHWLAIFLEPKNYLYHFSYGLGLLKGNINFLIKVLWKKEISLEL